jgi:hypothetical protein
LSASFILEKKNHQNSRQTSLVILHSLHTLPSTKRKETRQLNFS